jgi:hypothetical protein
MILRKPQVNHRFHKFSWARRSYWAFVILCHLPSDFFTFVIQISILCAYLGFTCFTHTISISSFLISLSNLWNKECKSKPRQTQASVRMSIKICLCFYVHTRSTMKLVCLINNWKSSNDWPLWNPKLLFL